MWRRTATTSCRRGTWTPCFRVDHVTGNIIWKLGVCCDKDLAPHLAGAERSTRWTEAPPRCAPPCRRQYLAVRQPLRRTAATRAAVYAVDTVAQPPLSRRSYARPTQRGGDDGQRPGQCGRTLVIGWEALAPLVTELDNTNKLVLELSGPDGGSYRAVKEPASSFDRRFYAQVHLAERRRDACSAHRRSRRRRPVMSAGASRSEGAWQMSGDERVRYDVRTVSQRSPSIDPTS